MTPTGSARQCLSLCLRAQINPFGQTPAFKDGDLLLVRWAHRRWWRCCSLPCALTLVSCVLGTTPQTESGAVVTYLADKYGSNHPLGTPTPESRATLARWVFFANSTLCTDLSAKNSRSLDVMESMLADGRDYLLGDFTLADAVIAIYLGWMRYFVKCDPGFTVDRWPKVKAYKDRVLARPSAKVVDMTWIEDESQWLL